MKKKTGDLWEKMMNKVSTTHAMLPVWKLEMWSR